MGYKPKVDDEDLRRYARMAVRLNQARPSHVWTPLRLKLRHDGSEQPGCRKCPAGSLFQNDQASHLYIIEEEP